MNVDIVWATIAVAAGEDVALVGPVDKIRDEIPGVQVLVHPECMREVVEKSDLDGKTYKVQYFERARFLPLEEDGGVWQGRRGDRP